MYYIYHIPGVKVGVTDNVHRRLKEQGYNKDEYEILEASKDVNHISDRERELQAQYGYMIDKVRYADKQKHYRREYKPMKLHVTKISTTFPVDKEQLRDVLMDNIGAEWISPMNYDMFISCEEHVDWIVKNLQSSKFANGKPYIYNKAYRQYLDGYEDKLNTELVSKPIRTSKAVTDAVVPGGLPSNQFDLIRGWATDKGILTDGDAMTQYAKLAEEMGELAQGLLKKRPEEIKDAIGDCVVVLTNLAAIENMSIEECIGSAWNEIKGRTGKMENGTFVKDS